ncbi:MAG: IS630 family transposase, partial [Methylobacter sp.]
TVTSEVQAWAKQRNQSNKPVDWRFTTEKARIKLKRLYPKLSD